MIKGVRFWGTPWIPPYAGVFNLPEDELREKWDLIPSDTDLLITHGPPAGILDAELEARVWPRPCAAFTPQFIVSAMFMSTAGSSPMASDPSIAQALRSRFRSRVAFNRLVL